MHAAGPVPRIAPVPSPRPASLDNKRAAGNHRGRWVLFSAFMRARRAHSEHLGGYPAPAGYHPLLGEGRTHGICCRPICRRRGVMAIPLMPIPQFVAQQANRPDRDTTPMSNVRHVQGDCFTPGTDVLVE
jgi:hypothetical protein